MNSLLRVWCIMLALSGANSLSQNAPVPSRVDPGSIEVSLVPNKTSVMLGEPTHFSFVVKNKSERDLQIIVGGDYQNRLGRPDTFSVAVVGDDGLKVPQPDAGESMGGMVGPQKLPASGAYTFRLFLPHWATFEKTGSYTITVRNVLRLNEVSKDDQDFMRGTSDVPSEASMQIQVVPLDPAKMGRLIDTLGRQMLSQVGRSDDREPTMALKAIQDERVIPHFLAALRTNDYEMKFHALDALAAFNSDMALEGLKEGMKTTAKDIANTTTTAVADQLADNIRHSAGVALSRSPHPGALPFLLEQRKDSYFGVRLDVVHALGKMKAKDAIPLLQEMTNDPNKMVSDEAKRYIELLNKTQ
jgi:hypothetical protein